MKKLVLIILVILVPLMAGCMMNQQGPSFEPTVEGMGWDYGDKLSLNARFSASPILVEDYILIPSLDGKIYAFDAEKGKRVDSKIWNFRIPQGIRSTPAYRDGILYFGAFDKNIYGIDVLNGEIRFTFETAGYISSSPLIINNFLFIGSYDGLFRAIDLSSNRLAWKFDTKSRIRGGAAESEVGVIFADEKGKLFHLNRDDGSVIWQTDICGEVYGAPVIKDEMVITADRGACVTALSLEDGSLIWQYKTSSPEHPIEDEFWCAPVCDDNAVYVGSSSGQFHALKLHPEGSSGESIWDVPFETTNGGDNRYAIMSEAVIHDGKIIFGSNGGKLYCLDIATGTEIWQFASFKEIRCRPLIIDNKVIFISNDNYLYGLNIEDGSPIRG